MIPETDKHSHRRSCARCNFAKYGGNLPRQWRVLQGIGVPGCQIERLFQQQSQNAMALPLFTKTSFILVRVSVLALAGILQTPVTLGSSSSALPPLKYRNILEQRQDLTKQPHSQAQPVEMHGFTFALHGPHADGRSCSLQPIGAKTPAEPQNHTPPPNHSCHRRHKQRPTRGTVCIQAFGSNAYCSTVWQCSHMQPPYKGFYSPELQRQVCRHMSTGLHSMLSISNANAGGVRSRFSQRSHPKAISLPTKYRHTSKLDGNGMAT